MATRSKLLCSGSSAGAAPVTLGIVPANTTWIVKQVSASGPSQAPNTPAWAGVGHKVSGGPLVFFQSLQLYQQEAGIPFFYTTNGPPIWEVFMPGDSLVVWDDGTTNLDWTISGAELSGVAP